MKLYLLSSAWGTLGQGSTGLRVGPCACDSHRPLGTALEAKVRTSNLGSAREWHAALIRASFHSP